MIEADVELTPVATTPGDDTVDQLVACYRFVLGKHESWDKYRQAMVGDERLIFKLTPTYRLRHAHPLSTRALCARQTPNPAAASTFLTRAGGQNPPSVASVWGL